MRPATARSTTARLLRTAFALALLAGVLAPALPASAHGMPPRATSEEAPKETWAGIPRSHTENPHRGLEEVGFNPFDNQGFNTDVWAWTRDDGLFAVNGTWGSLIGDDPCPSDTDNPNNPSKSGIKIVDATDPTNPETVARRGTVPGAQNNDVKVLRMDTDGGNPDFDGRDVLAHSLEPCGAELALSLIPAFEDVPREQTGFQLYDVTDPAEPVALGNFNNGGIGTHNLYMFNRPDLQRSFVLAVFNELRLLIDEDLHGVAQLVDITDPGSPTLVSEWELTDAEAQGGPPFDQLCQRRGTHLASCNLHDVWVSDDGNTAYLSFWDAGTILLDISDPTAPTFIGDIQSGTLEEEGNAHSVNPMSVNGRDLIIVGDEDFVGPGPLPHVVVDTAPEGGPVTAGEQWVGANMTDTPPVTEEGTGPFPALLADDEFGCVWGTASTVGATFEGWIGVARRGGTCPLFQQKVSAAETAGADGLIIVNNGPGSVAGLAAGTIPTIMIPGGQTDEGESREGERLIEAIQGSSPGDVVVKLQAIPPEQLDPWGFMRVFDVTAPNPANWEQVAEFRAPHVNDVVSDVDPDLQSVFSAHNPIIGPDGLVYFSWYTDGVRVLDIAADGSAREVAHFVPLPSDHPDDNDSDPHGVQEDNVGFWGSMAIEHPGTGELLVFNSDLNRGIYILRSTATGGGVGGTCPGGRNVSGEHVVGTPERDLLLGTPDDDVLCGLGSNDTLRGLGGNDVLLGGHGADRLVGGPGDDILRGFTQRDELRGGGGNDTLHGAQGGDRLVGAIGNDRLFGAKGRDRVIGGKGTDHCQGGPGNDTLQSCETGSA